MNTVTVLKEREESMKKIIFRIGFAIIPALPVWVIIGNLWVGIFVMFLTYVIIHFFQFSYRVGILSVYEYFSQHFIDGATGKKFTSEEFRQIVEADPEYNKKYLKVFRKNI